MTVSAKPIARSTRTASTMSRSVWGWTRPLAGAAILTVVAWQLGIDPFLDGVRAVNGAVLAAGAALGVLTTVACAWRWTIVARGFGLRLSLPTAVATYYRSIFLNLTLPGGVLGDVHRGVSHGRNVSEVGLALRAVAWERTAGQVVQAVVTVVVLLALPSPVRPSIPVVLLALVTLVVIVTVVRTMRAGEGRTRWARVRRAIADDARRALLPRKAWPAIALASLLVVAGHATAFVVAARAAGVTTPLSQLVPLALLALLAMVLPSVAGWGPREGVTAWAFAAAGLGAAQGVATAVVYGVMAFVAGLPGVLVLVAAWFPRPAFAQTDGAADA